MSDVDPARLVFVRRPDALWRRLHDDVIVLAPGTDRPVEISSPGARIWTLLEVATDAESIARALEDQVGVAAAEVRSHLVEVLHELAAVNAITPVGPAGPIRSTDEPA